MMERIKNIIKDIIFYYQIRNWILKKIENKKTIVTWCRGGKPAPPPPIIKQQVIRGFAKKFKLKILVETGTYYGHMIEAVKRDFDCIYSIELSEELYEQAKNKFRNDKNIKLINGDGGIELKKIIAEINQPALFWLDSHYSGEGTARGKKDTPIFEELTHILNSSESHHVIIIDDARCFGVEPDYPSIEDLSEFVRLKRPGVNIVVKDDSIRITPEK